MDVRNEITLVLRECGERTSDFAHELLCRAFPPSSVFRIHTTPFSQSLRKSYELGIAEGRPWTLCIDADVLVLPGGIEELLMFAAKQPESVFEVQGLVFDKFFNITRPAGNHLYRTAYLHEAIELIPEEGTSLRPESDTLVRMETKGRPWAQARALVGVHDFEQDYDDVYRKCFLQTHKHSQFVDHLRTFWEAKSTTDPDFAVAARAAEDGLSYHETVFVDKEFLKQETGRILLDMGLPAKPPIEPGIDPHSYIRAEFENLSGELHVARMAFEGQMHQHFFAAKDAELQIAGKLRKEYKSGHQKGQAEGRKQGCKEGREEVKRSREYQLGKAILRPVRKLGQWFGKKRGE